MQIIFLENHVVFPQKSHECALKLTDLWNTSLLFDLNYKFELIGASLLALAKSIYLDLTVNCERFDLNSEMFLALIALLMVCNVSVIY